MTIVSSAINYSCRASACKPSARALPERQSFSISAIQKRKHMDKNEILLMTFNCLPALRRPNAASGDTPFRQRAKCNFAMKMHFRVVADTVLTMIA